MCKHLSIFLVAVLLSALTLPVYASEVHKWVDAQGVTHYSDQFPENISSSVKQVDVSNTYGNTGSADYQEDYYSVTNQWARMRKERIERKQLQLEKAKQKVAQKPVVPRAVYINQAEEELNRNIYYSAHLPHFKHRGYRYKRYKKYGKNYSDRYTDGYKGTSCRWLRYGYPRSAFAASGGSGLTLTIR